MTYRIAPGKAWASFLILDAETQFKVAEVWSGDNQPSTAKARLNAQAMAAAPDMARLLTEFVRIGDAVQIGGEFLAACNEAKAVLETVRAVPPARVFEPPKRHRGRSRHR